MDATEMTSLVVAVVLPVATAVVPFLLLERRFRVFWTGLPLPLVELRTSAYRGVKVISGHTNRAPAIVRWAALSSFFMGQMFVPGLALGLIGLMAMGVGLVSPMASLLLRSRSLPAAGSSVLGWQAALHWPW